MTRIRYSLRAAFLAVLIVVSLLAIGLHYEQQINYWLLPMDPYTKAMNDCAAQGKRPTVWSGPEASIYKVECP